MSPESEPTGMPSTTPHGFQSWSRLAAELQLRIMTYVLAEEEPVQLFVGRAWERCPVKGTLDSILRIRNRALVQYALEAYYKNNTFAPQFNCRYSEKRLNLMLPSPTYRHWIKRLQLSLHTQVPLELTERTLRLHEYPWVSIFAPVAMHPDKQNMAYHAESLKRSTWQLSFPCLQVFEFIVVFAKSLDALFEGVHLCCANVGVPGNPRDWKLKQLEPSRAKSTADKVIVRAKSIGCRKQDRQRIGDARPNCGCEEIIEGKLGSLFILV